MSPSKQVKLCLWQGDECNTTLGHIWENNSSRREGLNCWNPNKNKGVWSDMDAKPCLNNGDSDASSKIFWSFCLSCMADALQHLLSINFDLICCNCKHTPLWTYTLIRHLARSSSLSTISSACWKHAPFHKAINESDGDCNVAEWH